MSKSLVKSALLRSFRRMLRPLVRIVIRYDVGYGDIATALKEAMVEVAARDSSKEQQLDASGLAKNIGLNTADFLETLKSLANEKEGLYEKDNDRVANILEGWHRDDGYVGVYGLANELNRAEFNSLCDRHGSGRDPEYIEYMMVAAGCVKIIEGESDSDRRYKCLSRSYVPIAQTEPKLHRMGQMIARFAQTLDNNVHELGEIRLEKRVWPSSGFEKKNLPLLDGLVREKSEEMLFSIDSWISTFGGAENLPPKDVIHTGVGVYHYVDDESDDVALGDLLRDRGIRTD